jgi:multiple sugar transport system permease protein
MKKEEIKEATLTGLTYFILFLIMIPALWVIFTSIRPGIEVNTYPPIWIPRRITLEKYQQAFFSSALGEQAVPIKNYLANSLVASLGSAVIALILGTLAGFAFSRFDFKGRDTLFLLIILSRAVPGIALSLPLFMLFVRLKLLDTLAGLSLVYIAYNIPFMIWIMDGFFREIPRDLEDAAEIDGCTKWQAFLKVDLPLSAPGLSACGIFAFLMAWNEFQLASVLTRSLSSKTLPVGLFDFTSQFVMDWRGMCAMAVIMFIPAIFFTFLVSKHLIKGLTFGAIK